MERQDLKGGCYVLSGVTGEGLRPLIGADTGAEHLSQYALHVKGESRIYSFGQAEVLLFVTAGTATVTISGKSFEARPESGLIVRPGEAFRVTPSPQPSPPVGRGSPAERSTKALSLAKSAVASREGGRGESKMKSEAKGSNKALSLDGRGLGEGEMKRETEATLLITVCPEAKVKTLDTMPNNFDASVSDRLAAADASKREEMGDRSYQVLASTGNVTQFIGEIPKSKAPSHHHLYEEALYVLSGEGFMWTDDVKAPVSPGSIIFLPKKQEHSLECTSDAGLRVAGHFYPAGSPAENY